MIRKAQFQTSLEKIARMLSNRYGIRVVFRANDCYTTGKTIYHPVIPDNAPQEFIDACCGIIDHESGHIIFTDFDELNERIQKDGSGAEQKLHAIWNALEDARINQKMSALWRGSGINFKRLYNWSSEQVVDMWDGYIDAEGNEVPPPDPFTKFTKLLNLRAENYLNGNKYQELESLFAQKSPELVPVVYSMMDILTKLKTNFDLSEYVENGATTRVVELAREILDRLQQMKEGGGGGSGENDGEENNSSSSSGKINPEDGEEESEGPKTGNPGGGSDAGADMDWFNMNSESDGLPTTEQLIKNYARGELEKSDTYLTYTTENDHIAPVESLPSDREEYHLLMEKACRIVGPVYKQLLRVLTASKRTGWLPNQTSGFLDANSLYKLGMLSVKDDPSFRRVFRRHQEAVDFNTAVVIDIDHSGSMCGHPLQLAGQVGMLLGEVMFRLGIPFEIFGHSTVGNQGSYRFRQASPEDQNLFARWGDLWIGQYKRFEDNWLAVKYRLATAARRAQCNSYDGEVLRYACSRVSSVGDASTRRVVFELKDGCPCPNVHNKYRLHTQHLEDAVQEATRAGIEVIGVGICTNYVRDFYPNSVEVNNLQDMPGVMVRELGKILLRGRNRAMSRGART